MKTVNISDELHRRVKMIAAHYGIAAKEIIEDYINTGVSKSEIVIKGNAVKPANKNRK